MKNSGWTNALFALIFLAVPGLLLMFLVFRLSGIDNNIGVQIGIATGFLVYGFLFSFIVVKIEWLNIDSLSFNLPLTIVFTLLMASYEGPIWLMAILAFVGVMTALPINSFVHKLKNKQRRRNK